MSNDIERARQALENKLSSKGYEHPQTTNSNSNVYKKFNADSRKSKYASFNKNVTTYGSFDQSNEDARLTVGRECPVCKDVPVYKCDCDYEHFSCLDKHSWWVDDKNIIHNGKPTGNIKHRMQSMFKS